MLVTADKWMLSDHSWIGIVLEDRVIFVLDLVVHHEMACILEVPYCMGLVLGLGYLVVGVSDLVIGVSDLPYDLELSFEV